MKIIIITLCLLLCISTGVLLYTIFKFINKLNASRNAALSCLIDLVNKLNKELPGCNLKVQNDRNEMKVIGEIKYYKTN